MYRYKNEGINREQKLKYFIMVLMKIAKELGIDRIL